MKNLICVSVLSVLLCYLPAHATSKFSWEVSPVFLFNSGTTDYNIEFLTYELTPEGDTVLKRGESKLEFPLDASLAGIELEAQTRTATGQDLTFSAGILIDVTNPSEKMLDHDWWSEPDGSQSYKWSYTESDTKLNYLLLKLEAAISIVQKPKMQLALMAGFHYNKVEFDMMGYEGWQIRDGRTYYSPPADPNVKVLYYKASYKLPQAGVRLRVMPGEQTLMVAQMAIGRLIASDLDDHVLRGKTAEASTTGWAFIARARGRALLARHGTTRPFISGQFEYMKQSASGSQTQTWYRDEIIPDPGGGEDLFIEKGTSVPGIPYETSAHQMRIGIGFGLSF